MSVDGDGVSPQLSGLLRIMRAKACPVPGPAACCIGSGAAGRVAEMVLGVAERSAR